MVVGTDQMSSLGFKVASNLTKCIQTGSNLSEPVLIKVSMRIRKVNPCIGVTRHTMTSSITRSLYIL